MEPSQPQVPTPQAPGEPPDAEPPDADAPDADAPDADAEGRIARTTRRAHQEQERITRRVEQTRQRLEAARPKSLWVDAMFRTHERDSATGGVVLAGALAFRIFLFLIPYIFVLTVGFGLAAEASEQDPADLARKAGIAGIAASAIGSTKDLSTFERIAAIVIGLFALFLASRSLLKVLRVVHALAWRVRAGKFRNLSKATLVLIGTITASLVITVLIGKLRDESFALGLIAVLLTAAVPFAFWVVVSWFLPSRATRWEEVVPGAALFGIGVLGLHIVTIYWISHQIETKTETYGAIGAALAILLWAYLLGRLMAAGAVLNMALWERRQEDETQPTAPTA